MNIRCARPDETDSLSVLAFRSKAYWPYERLALEAYRPQLDVLMDDIRADSVYVLEVQERTAGFYALSSDHGHARLHFLFVEPDLIGRGYGRALWDHALNKARSRGWRSVTLYADAYAVRFYEHVGCEPTGQVMATSLGVLKELSIGLNDR